MDLVPMTFTIEKFSELEVDVMVHKNMIHERKSENSDYVHRFWNNSNASIPDEVRDHIIECDEDYCSSGDVHYSEITDASNCYGGAISYVLTKDGLVHLDVLPELSDDQLIWTDREEDTSADSTQETSSTSVTSD